MKEEYNVNVRLEYLGIWIKLDKLLVVLFVERKPSGAEQYDVVLIWYALEICSMICDTNKRIFSLRT